MVEAMNNRKTLRKNTEETHMKHLNYRMRVGFNGSGNLWDISIVVPLNSRQSFITLGSIL
jgi:hypothetical protein